MLSDPVTTLVGDKTGKILRSGLGIITVEDLLRHYPRRYAERGELTDLASLQLDEHVTVMAKVEKIAMIPMRGRRGDRLVVEVTDGRGRLSLTFFNQAWRTRDLKPGRLGLFSGRVGIYNGKRQLTHPDYVLMDGEGESPDPPQLADQVASQAAAAFAQALIPVYPATAALPSWRVALCVGAVLDVLPELPDPIPEQIRRERGFVGLREAFVRKHRPQSRDDVKEADERLVYEEALVLQVELARRRAAARALPAVPRVAREGGLLEAFDARLPFTLTAGQLEVGAAIAADLAGEHPMQRLLQGEVGSGKTVVAVRAMLAVVDSGGQAALLAPTEVLAQQHLRSITGLLGPLAERGMLGGAETATRVALLTGSMDTAARRRAMLDAASGEAGIVIGTHALLEEKVKFFDLGLVVVDEQHRFGVEQRAALTTKGEVPPHVLVMTATPIPRTVAMTVFGDLEVSTLSELPGGRPPITTHVVPTGEKPHFLDRAWQRVREEVAAGHQVYVVCPRIGADDEPPPEDGAADGRAAAAVLDVAPRLAAGELAGLRVDILHGRMAPDAKDDVMRRFVAGSVDVLVSTTVVEVGVDVANATVMVIMDADRFGVSQLHQLRGRVGRGSAPGLALLVTELAEGHPARARLDAVASTLDGFELSRVDLEARREGDVLGASQAGRRSSLRLLSVFRHEDEIAEARADAALIVADDPDLVENPALAAAVQSWVGAEQGDFLEKA